MDNNLLKEFLKNEGQFMELVNSALSESEKIIKLMEKGEDIGKASEYKRFLDYMRDIQDFTVERKKPEMEYFEQITSSASEQEKLDMLYNCLVRELGAYEGFEIKKDLTHSISYLTHALSFFLSVLINNSYEQREKVLDVYLKAIEGLNLPFKTDKEEIKSILGKHLTGIEYTEIAIDTPEKAFYTLDRISEVVFNKGVLLNRGENKGSVALTPKQKEKHEKDILFVLDDSIGELKLTPTQRRLLSAMGTLFLSAQEQEKECICTLNQVMDLMGHNSHPNKVQRDKVIQEMRKISCVRIVQDLDNKKGQVLKVDESMLNYSLAIMTNKGRFVESALKVWDLPPIFKIAKHLNDEITSLPKDILKLPQGMSMTDNNLKLQDFFIKKIARLNNPHSKSISPNVTYAYLCELTSSKRVDRVKENTYKILDHFQELGFIKGYDKKKNGLHIDILTKKEREQLFLN